MKKTLKCVALSLALIPLLGACSSGIYSDGAVEKAKCKASSFRVGSFNILGGSGNKEGSRERAEIGAGLVRFHDWDLFGTQEMFDWQKSVYLGKDGVYGVVGRPCCTKEEDPKGQRWGNYIFYKKDRFDVLDSGYFWLTPTPDKPSKGWTEKQYRICNWGKFRDKITGKELFFFDLHQGLTPDSRLESAKLIVKKIGEIAGKDATVFMTGDFNAVLTEASIKEILASGLVQDSWGKSKTAPYGHKGTFMPANHNRDKCDQSGKSGGKKIDYVFVSPNVSVLKCGVVSDNRDTRYPSDHFPIMCFVKID